MNKKTIKLIIKKKFRWLFRVRDCINSIKSDYFNNTNPKLYGAFGEHSVIQTPCSISDPSLIFIDDYVGIRCHFSFDGYIGKLFVKKYTIIGRNCVIVTSNHIKSVGLPQYYSTVLHIDDRCCDIEIGEDVWIGANCTIIPGSKIGRGCIVGACSLVNTEIPPYAVVVGSPCKIIGSSYTLEEIIKHESSIYPLEERLSKRYLNDLFEKYYAGKRNFGKSDLSEEQISNIINSI